MVTKSIEDLKIGDRVSVGGKAGAAVITYKRRSKIDGFWRVGFTPDASLRGLKRNIDDYPATARVFLVF